eukprot:Nitzschia sp. Nitz4//scaffold276_size25055//110//689//NITZ4_008337-RA/size25055-snap-gene-0.27-mRNA-1//-1//CDS//3329545313//1724//frame0
MMQAVRCHEFAALEKAATTGEIRMRKTAKNLSHVLSLDTIPRPELPDPDQVIIQTCYAGVQYPDALQAQGLYQVRPPLPYIPAMDLTRVGDRVMASTSIQNGGTGSMAEYVKISASLVYKVPPTVHLSQCANIGRNFFVAYHSLKSIGNVGPGSLVLVDGASGGMGMVTIELANANSSL